MRKEYDLEKLVKRPPKRAHKLTRKTWLVVLLGLLSVGIFFVSLGKVMDELISSEKPNGQISR